MNVLVACEESQTVCIAFRKKGHEAFSCDIQEPSGGHPEWHIHGDALELIIPGKKQFKTMDGKNHSFEKFDLLIAHPPCTYLTNAGAVRMKKNGIIDKKRHFKMICARMFFLKFYENDCEKICIENPVPMKLAGLPPYSQIIQPYEFGHPYSKKTCLWLKGLPPLLPTSIGVGNITPWVSGGSKDGNGNPRKRLGVKHSQKERSKTFEGIGDAMADQWG